MWHNLFFIITPLIGHAEDYDYENAAESQWNKISIFETNIYQFHVKQEQCSWHNFQVLSKQKLLDSAINEHKTYVLYFYNHSTLIKLDYELEIQSAENLVDPKKKGQNSKEKIKTTSSDVVGDNTPNIILDNDDLGTESIETAKASKKSTLAENGKLLKLYRITFRNVSDFIKKRARKFNHVVDNWVKKNKPEGDYLLFIIHEEKIFSVQALSWIPRNWLMKIIHHYASQDVLKAVTGKVTKPDPDFQNYSTKNIMLWVTYFRILRDDYFPNLKDKRKKMYLMNANYIWEPRRIKKAIKKRIMPVVASSAEKFDKIRKIGTTEIQDHIRRVSENYIRIKKTGF